MRKYNYADKAVKLARNIFSIMGVAFTGFLGIRSAMMYKSVAMDIYCTLALAIVALICIKHIGKVIRRQHIQKRNVKSKRLLTYHK